MTKYKKNFVETELWNELLRESFIKNHKKFPAVFYLFGLFVFGFLFYSTKKEKKK